MKDFFKRNLWYFILGGVLIVLLLLGNLSTYIFVVSLAGFCAFFAVLAVKFYKTYKQKLDYDPSSEYFDATNLDYDEEIYYIGEGSRTKKQIKNKFARLEALIPFLICLFISIGFLVMAVYSIIKYII